MNRWTENDIKILEENYIFGNIKKLCELLDNKFTYNSITTKANKLGIHSRKYWQEEEIEILKNYYHKLEPKEMCGLLPDRNIKTIIMKASELGLKNYVSINLWFSEEDILFIQENWKTMSDEEIAEKLGRKYHAIVDQRGKLGLSRYGIVRCYENLSEYVRRNNLDWKIDAMKKSNYKCVLTGERFDDIHHIYGLDKILVEAIENLGYSFLKDISEYTDLEMDDILKSFRKTQSQYPSGVCLTKNIHMLFHKLYGYGNNTPEQWDDFLHNYKNGILQEQMA